jgi:DNA-binding response OmpR family regulator
MNIPASPGERPGMNRRVLVIEDEQDIAALVGLHLKDLDLEVATCANGHDGLDRALTEHWDLVVLDLSLPGMDGLEVCRRVRLDGEYTPILMLTARSTEMDRVLGLETGADDYLTKPFGIIEFIARVKAILRRVQHLRNQPMAASQVLRIGDLTIEVDERIVTRAGRRLELTAREFSLLVHFARHPGKVFSRSELLDQVWGMTHDAYEHTVSSHINRLRAKIEPDPTDPRYLVTVWGTGYRLDNTRLQ